MFKGNRETQEGIVNTLLEAMQKIRNAATLLEATTPWHADEDTRAKLSGTHQLLDQAGTTVYNLMSQQVQVMESVITKGARNEPR